MRLTHPQTRPGKPPLLNLHTDTTVRLKDSGRRPRPTVPNTEPLVGEKTCNPGHSDIHLSVANPARRVPLHILVADTLKDIQHLEGTNLLDGEQTTKRFPDLACVSDLTNGHGGIVVDIACPVNDPTLKGKPRATMIRPMPPHPGRPRMTRLPAMLRAHMKANSMTMDDVAEYCDVSARQVDRWLKGDSEPKLEREHRVAELLSVSPVDFYEPGVYSDIPVSPGLYEEIRGALTDVTVVLREIGDALKELRQTQTDSRNDLSLLVGSLVPGLEERVKGLREQLVQQGRAEGRSEEEPTQLHRLGGDQDPNGA